MCQKNIDKDHENKELYRPLPQVVLELRMKTNERKSVSLHVEEIIKENLIFKALLALLLLDVQTVRTLVDFYRKCIISMPPNANISFA